MPNKPDKFSKSTKDTISKTEIENSHPYEYRLTNVDFSTYDIPFILKNATRITQLKSPYQLNLYHEEVRLNHLELGLDYQTKNSPVIVDFSEDENQLVL